MPISTKVIEEIASLIAYILGGAFVLYTTAKKHFPDKLRFDKKIDLIAINHVLERHRLALEAARVDLLYYEEKEADMYCTLIAEAIEDAQHSFIGEWNQQKADAPYRAIIEDAEKNGISIIEDVTKEPDGVLRNACAIVNLVSLIFLYVNKKKKHNYFSVVSWTNKTEVDDKTKERIRLLRSDLKQLIG